MIINSKTKSYELIFHKNILKTIDPLWEKIDVQSNSLFFFIDENVYRIYNEDIKNLIKDSKFITIPAFETNKDYLKLAEYYQWLIDNKFTRNDFLVTIGGGILQDISGFIASTLYRGIKWIFIPTTLLSQADSCIGSKTSINFNNGKNLIGSFYPPDYIFNDIVFCNTLTGEYFNSGIGEIIKFHLLSDTQGYSKLLEYLNSSNLRTSEKFQSIIKSTLEIKYSYFADDEYDSGRRNLLNYGHCFGHALESATNFKICHGEAVIVGMGFANLLALKRNILTTETYNEIEKILKRFYPVFNIKEISVDSLIHFLKKDKKRIGKDLTMVLLKDIGIAEKYNDIKEHEISKVYADFTEIYITE